MAAEKKVSSLSHLTRDLFIYPDLHGNRSPLADSSMRGMIMGLKLDRGVSDLTLRYFATLEAIALQTRQIVESLNSKGHEINSIYMSGGQVKNPVFMQLISDVCKVPVQLPFSSSASVVAGSAILGRFAADIVNPDNSTGEFKPKEKGVIKTQEDAEKFSYANRDHLWDLMVSRQNEKSLNSLESDFNSVSDSRFLSLSFSFAGSNDKARYLCLPNSRQENERILRCQIQSESRIRLHPRISASRSDLFLSILFILCRSSLKLLKSRKDGDNLSVMLSMLENASRSSESIFVYNLAILSQSTMFKPQRISLITARSSVPTLSGVPSLFILIEIISSAEVGTNRRQMTFSLFSEVCTSKNVMRI